MESELFPIKGFEGIYSITRDGRIWSHARMIYRKIKGNFKSKGQWLKSRKDEDGYPLYSLHKQEITKVIRIHRLVALTFLPNPENKPQVNHKNLIKTDNHVENLEWCTHKENAHHAKKNGIYEGRRKVTKEQTIQIRKNHPSEGVYKNKLWEQYDISPATYRQIINKKGVYENG